MRYDLVIPIDDVEATVRTEVNSHGAEPLVVRREEITLFLIAMVTVFITHCGDDLDAVCDRVRYEKNVFGRAVELIECGLFVFGQGNAAEAGSAHLKTLQ